jgi:hypothetical protein
MLMKMKNILAIFLLSASALSAAETLTKGERDRAMSELHASRKMVSDLVAGLSNAQLNWKPTAQRWSAAEVVEHLAMIEDMLFGVYQQVAASPADPAKKSRTEDAAFLLAVRSRTQKVQAPDPATPKGTFPNTAAALAAFNERRHRNIQFVEKTMDADLRHKIMPGFGIDGYQIFLLLAAHAQRHGDQISEILATEGFPKK